MMIKDLEMSKELDREALVEVRGGFAIAGGQYAPQAITGGGILSPTAGYNGAVNAAYASDNDSYSYMDLGINTSNILASVGTLVAQV